MTKHAHRDKRRGNLVELSYVDDEGVEYEESYAHKTTSHVQEIPIGEQAPSHQPMGRQTRTPLTSVTLLNAQHNNQAYHN